MADRHAGYVVVLKKNTKDEDAAATLAAIKELRGVLTVEPIIADTSLQIAEARIKSEVKKHITDVLADL